MEHTPSWGVDAATPTDIREFRLRFYRYDEGGMGTLCTTECSHLNEQHPQPPPTNHSHEVCVLLDCYASGDEAHYE
jgi:hypothetical protein